MRVKRRKTSVMMRVVLMGILAWRILCTRVCLSFCSVFAVGGALGCFWGLGVFCSSGLVANLLVR